MIGLAARVLIGVVVGAVLSVALITAIIVDLFAHETRPSMRLRASKQLRERALREALT